MLKAFCMQCSQEFEAKRSDARYCSATCRKRADRLSERANQTITPVVLELFPGAGLLGRAFESEGFCVVRGPDILWGGDVRNFHVPAGRFDGVIGGPPCQQFSSAAITGTTALNLIPEFIRLIEEAKPKWAVMENVPRAMPAAPDWPHTLLEDFDCGGLTSRIRGFWFYGVPACPEPPHRDGARERTVLATSWKGHDTPGFPKHNYLKASEAARLQGFPGLDVAIKTAQPCANQNSGLSASSREIIAGSLLGNGVPFAMGQWVARHVMGMIKTGQSFAPYQAELFS